MAWTIKLTPSAQKQLSAIDRTQAKRIRDFLLERVVSLEDPNILSTKLKGGKWGDLWRFRVGDYRIVYSPDFDQKTLFIVRIAHRSEAYR